ncbi:hypothetical protein CK203_055873 [Vitis vinifera]|uniref:Uncharacterized protein n=1 Tax=Vitis vinifera TaxID=29760 RepID=A0A438GP94_VITVI|nr:hypothetical protein CK203_055873 [Vitis vinifera]
MVDRRGESPSRDGEMDLDDSPSKSMLQGTNKGHQMKVSSRHSFSNSESNTEEEISNTGVKGFLGLLILFPFFLIGLRGEHYDRSRSVGEGPQFEVPLCVLSGDGTEENENGCWDLVETNGGSDKLGVRSGAQA